MRTARTSFLIKNLKCILIRFLWSLEIKTGFCSPRGTQRIHLTADRPRWNESRILWCWTWCQADQIWALCQDVLAPTDQLYWCTGSSAVCWESFDRGAAVVIVSNFDPRVSGASLLLLYPQGQKKKYIKTRRGTAPSCRSYFWFQRWENNHVCNHSYVDDGSVSVSPGAAGSNFTGADGVKSPLSTELKVRNTRDRRCAVGHSWKMCNKLLNK